ncbi:MAG: hypothetical protein ACOC56_00600 [Atribacterota bacterium]
MFIDKKKLYDMLNSGELDPLESDVEIEDLILLIKSIDDKTDFLKKLKKARTQSINDEIDKLSERKQAFREIIEKTMRKFNHKSLNFPGVGRVLVRPGKSKWVINNEDALINYLENQLDDKDFQNIVQEKLSISKKELNKVLDGMEKQNKILPDSVNKETAPDSVTISPDKKSDDLKEKSQSIDQNIDLDNEFNEDDYDGIDEVNF